MFVTRTNLPIYLTRVNEDKRFPLKAHIIEAQDNTFCFCKRLTANAPVMVIAENDVYEILLDLDLVCKNCLRRYNEFIQSKR